MAKFVKGDIVVVPFPFSDLTQAKRRPALVIVDLEGDDIILCQITSQLNKDNYSIPLNENDFREGNLRQISNIRPNRIFTADTSIILYRVGALKGDMINRVIDKIIELLHS
ncbi:MAG: type II toxin-antitoxin system PemK/MazF family toxin [Desulfobaccales bacterium]